ARWANGLDCSFQIDHEPGAFARAFAKRPDRAAVHFNDGFADGEPETEPFPMGAALLKSVEDFLKVAGLNADPGVANLHMESLRSRIRRADGDLALSGRKFRGVLEQIPED